MKKIIWLLLASVMVAGGYLYFDDIKSMISPDPCEAVVCQNGGTCNEGICDCPDGYSGENCEIQDLCFGVSCTYDGKCKEGKCVCADLTQDYILGTWIFEETDESMTFHSNGNFTTNSTPQVTYTLNTSARTIDIIDLDGTVWMSFNIPEEQFSCNKFNWVNIKNGSQNMTVRQ